MKRWRAETEATVINEIRSVAWRQTFINRCLELSVFWRDSVEGDCKAIDDTNYYVSEHYMYEKSLKEILKPDILHQRLDHLTLSLRTVSGPRCICIN